jgi:hypothetical protein
MKTDEAIKVLKAALIALDQGKLAAVRALITKVIQGLSFKRHK